MAKFIVAIETVKIKEFLFSTNKLKVIRGASYLLDYLNQEVKKLLKNDNRINEKDIIYVGAGNAKFFVERENKEEAEKVVKEIIEEVKEKYSIEAPGVKVVGVYEIYDQNSNKRVWDIFDKLGLDTAKQKNKGFPILNIDLPYVEKCELNSDEPAEIYSENLEKDLNHIIERYNANDSFKFKIDKETLLYDGNSERTLTLKFLKKQINRLTKTPKENNGKISEGTFWKLVYSNFVKSYNKNEVGFYRYVKLDKEIDLDNETTIDNFEDEDSFIGFVYSDGDDLGDFLKNVKNSFIDLDNKVRKKDEKNDIAEKLYITFLKKFSNKLDSTTKSTLTKVLDKIFAKEKDEKKKWGEFLIVGGDDVCAVFDPTLAIKISNNFQKEFEKNMAKKIRILAKTFYRIFKNDIFSSEIQNLTEEMEKIKITSSSGVVIAKTKTPIFQLFKQGLKLQKKAKARRKEMKKIFPSLATGFIDFQVIGSEGTVNIDNFRNNITLKDNKIMERPYPINFNIPTEDKVKNLDSLLKLISEMKKINFPSNKLRYIYDLKRNINLEDFKKKIDFINILSKMSDDHIKFIKERFYLDYTNPNTFKNNFNNIFDILEIYDFIEEEEVEA